MAEKENKNSSRQPSGPVGGHGPMGRGHGGGKAKNFRAAWGKLLSFCKPYLVVVIIATLFAVASAVLNVLRPTLISDIFQNILNWDKVMELGVILGIMIGAAFILGFITEYIMATITQKIAKKLRAQITGKINKLPLSYFDKTTYGDVLSRLTNDTDTVSQTLNHSLVTLVSSVTLLLGCIIAMFLENVLLAVTAIVSSFGVFFIMGIIIKKSQKYFIMQQKSLGDVNGFIEEYYSSHTVIKASNAQDAVQSKLNEKSGELYQSAWKSQFFGGLMMPLMSFIGNFSYLCICVVGGILVFNGTITADVIVAFMLYVRIFTQPLNQLAQTATNMQSTAAASERVFEFLEEPEMEDESALTQTLQSVKGAVTFKNVRFGYNSAKPVIKDFTADIKPGSKVAIVGPTGAGKTTLVNLLMKFYKVDSGDILVDGVSINSLTRENVHALFGMVLQDTWLFEGTVRENLAYNNADVTTEELDTACKTTGIDHFISTLPKGYNTILNEQASVSGGQKQLLTIARAMIKNAPLLILDEATSSVDTRTEVLLQEAMDKLTKNRTSFVIAHRLSTIKNADLILVLKDGDIIESGSHTDLIKKRGFYADLYNSQFTLEGTSA